MATTKIWPVKDSLARVVDYAQSPDKRACAENGKFMGTYPAYGYRRDPLDKHHGGVRGLRLAGVRVVLFIAARGFGFLRGFLAPEDGGVGHHGTVGLGRLVFLVLHGDLPIDLCRRLTGDATFFIGGGSDALAVRRLGRDQPALLEQFVHQFSHKLMDDLHSLWKDGGNC